MTLPLAQPMPRLLSQVATLVNRHPDLVIATALSVLAAALRLWQLGEIPQGVHGDEAQFAMDAQRVLESGWIGPYTTSALGQPSGIAYLIAPGQALFGATALGARFSLAIFAIAAVPLSYALFRLLTDRTLATIATSLLAVSLWHIHFSRVAHTPAMVPTVELAVLLLWTLGIKRGGWYWFAAAGAALGLGLYTYNVYPIFVVAFSVWVALYTLIWRRGPAFLPWARNVALAAVVSVLAGLPLFLHMGDPGNDYFGHYRGYYEQYSVLQSEAFENGGLGDRIDVISGQLERFFGAYVAEGIPDFVDAASPDGRPMFDELTVGLLLVGIVHAAWRWRDPSHLLALTMLAIIPLTSVLQTNATYRGSLGTVPFVSFLAALPLALVWQHAPAVRPAGRTVFYGAVVLAIAFIGYTSINVYFRGWAESDLFPWVYTQEISEASLYLNSLPGKPYVYFYSGRWSFDYETRQYLAPDAHGEDRSEEFAGRLDFDIDRSRDSVMLLLPPYLAEIETLQRLFPAGNAERQRDGNDLLFIAYHVPAWPASDAPAGVLTSPSAPPSP